ncbi:TIGR01458 family HAD-type hydrolase [Marinobacteraceae bacterium S3BR75-40.1]
MPEGLLIDLSGVLYAGNKALPGAIEALEKVRAHRIPHLFLTNTTRRTRQQLADHLNNLGFYLDPGRIQTAVEATASYLRERRLTPYLLIQPSVKGAFADLAGPLHNAVVLGDAGEGFDYDHLNRAFRLVMDGAPLIAMGDNRYFRDEDGGLSLDIGPFKAALAYAAEVEATVIGKPSATFFHMACQHLALKPEDTLMIGDDAENDVKAAMDAGLQGCLVKTGKYRESDEDKCPRADLQPDFASAVEAVLKNGEG